MTGARQQAASNKTPRPRRCRAGVAVWVVLVSVVAASPARSTDEDYGVNNRRWNGLSTLVALAQGVGLSVASATRIHWKELSTDDIVFVLYPTNPVASSRLSGFLRRGGRVLWADDFGRGDAIMRRFSMLRKSHVDLPPARYQQLDFAPVATALATDHPLAEKVAALTCNHPAVLSGVKGSEVIFGFAADQAVVVAGAVGQGRFVVLADPSVLINRMLEFAGNLRFASNLLRYFKSAGAAQRLVVLTGDIAFYGEPEPRAEKSAADSFWVRGNLWLEELNDYFMTPDSLRMAGVMIALGLAIWVMWSMPSPARLHLSPPWVSARPSTEGASSYHEIVRRFARAGRRESWLVPAVMVRDTLVFRLVEVTALPAPLHDELSLNRALRRAAGSSAAALISLIYSDLCRIERRQARDLGRSSGYLSKRDFARLNRVANQLYRIFDELESSTGFPRS